LPSLKALQAGFVASAYGAVSPRFAAAVTGGGRLSAREAVDVYRRGYPARMSEALGETFEACWRVLGDADFLKDCAAYARSVPSVTHNLSDYGRTFPAFLLKRHRAHAPFIADLAQLEWEFKNLFHEKPAESGSAAAAHGGSTFVLAPHRLLSFGHRVHAIWRRDRDDDSPLRKADWTGAERILLHKKGSRVLSAAEAKALASLAKGRPLADALEKSGLDEDGTRAFFEFLGGAGLVAEVR
jgi:hypothetical protein